ncbi:MAG: phosphatase PAP2 family protein [Planctomycetota bacterium]
MPPGRFNAASLILSAALLAAATAGGVCPTAAAAESAPTTEQLPAAGDPFFVAPKATAAWMPSQRAYARASNATASAPSLAGPLDAALPDPVGFRDDPPPYSIWNLRNRLLDDAQGFATAPLRWGVSGWTEFAFFSAAIGGSMAWADANVDRFNQIPSPRQKRFWQFVSNNNATWTFGLEAVLFTAGYGFGVPRAQTVWLETIEATTVASGVLSPLLKLTVGRQRPDAASHAHVFKPFSGNASFPSGHTTQAFVVATAVAVAYADHPWVGVLTFSAAGMVGYSRLFLHKHFLSDVLAGALLGAGVGYEAVALHRHWFGDGSLASADAATGAMPSLSVVSDGISTGLQLEWHF